MQKKKFQKNQHTKLTKNQKTDKHNLFILFPDFLMNFKYIAEAYLMIEKKDQ